MWTYLKFVRAKGYFWLIFMDLLVEVVQVSACGGALRKTGQHCPQECPAPFLGLASTFEHFLQHLTFDFLKSLIAFLPLGHV